MIRDMTLALAIAALVLSVISLAFTGYQWRRSGPTLAIKELGSKRSGERMLLTAEIVSVGRLPATVRTVEGLTGDCNQSWSSQSWTGMPVESLSRTLPAKLEPSDVLEVGFALPLDLQNVDFSVWVRAQSGHQWVENRRQVKYSIEPGGMSSMSLRG